MPHMRVIESMGPALETAKRLLFRPFQAGTWFSLGVVFFLQSCIEGGGSPAWNLPRSGDHSHSGSNSNLAALGRVSEPIQDLLRDGVRSELLVLFGILAIVLVIPLALLAIWLGTRGQMMAIRAVAIGESDIGRLWNATRNAAAALFRFHLALGAIMLAVCVPVLGGIGLLAFPLSHGNASDGGIFVVRLCAFAVGLLVLLAMLVVHAMTRNFVAPLMLKYDLTARQAWQRFWRVGRGHVGPMVGFFALRLLVGAAASIAGLVAGVLTCCLGFMPVLHQTLMAPYYVFERAWSLSVLAAMSPDFDLRTPPVQHPYPPGPYPPYAGPHG
jgi:hypothetical protein